WEGSPSKACRRASPLPIRSAAPGASPATATHSSCRPERHARPWCHCRSRHCGSPPTPSPCSARSASNVSPTSWIARAPRWRARSGSQLRRRLDQPRAWAEKSIPPCHPLPLYVAEQRFAEPIVLERDVLGTIQRLGARLELTLEQHGEGARLIEVILFRVDGK